jgi:hypothetical protein
MNDETLNIWSEILDAVFRGICWAATFLACWAVVYAFAKICLPSIKAVLQ